MSKVSGRVTGGSVLPPPVTIGPLRMTNRAEVRFAPAWLAYQTWTNPVVGDLDGYVTDKTSTALPAAAGSVTFTPDGIIASARPDYPRNVVITVTHGSSVVAASGVITGKDEYGAVITEAWSVTATGTTKTFTGVVAFAEITSITYVTAADATANTFKAGTGKAFGFSFPNAVASAVKEIASGTVVTNGTLVVASSAANTDARGIYTPNGTPDGSADWTVYYITTAPGTLV